VPFENGWRNLGGKWDRAAYYVDALAVLHLRGQVTGGTIGGTIFTLGCNLAPRASRAFATISADLAEVAAFGQVTVDNVPASISGGIATLCPINVCIARARGPARAADERTSRRSPAPTAASRSTASPGGSRTDGDAGRTHPRITPKA